GVGAKVAVAAEAGAGAEVAEEPQAAANNTSNAANPPTKLVPFLCPVRNRFIEFLALATSNPAEIMFMPGCGPMLDDGNPRLFKYGTRYLGDDILSLNTPGGMVHAKRQGPAD
ncbi:MAG: hypothetical protein IH962_03755, partial [Chloroflexi bacterium]|nr:hypothetical protein [Chloroflexota bacterium]